MGVHVPHSTVPKLRYSLLSPAIMSVSLTLSGSCPSFPSPSPFPLPLPFPIVQLSVSFLTVSSSHNLIPNLFYPPSRHLAISRESRRVSSFSSLWRARNLQSPFAGLLCLGRLRLSLSDLAVHSTWTAPFRSLRKVYNATDRLAPITLDGSAQAISNVEDPSTEDPVDVTQLIKPDSEFPSLVEVL